MAPELLKRDLRPRTHRESHLASPALLVPAPNSPSPPPPGPGTLSSDDRYAIAANFFSILGILQYELAFAENIWTRGGVSIGNLAMDSRTGILVGQPFIDAYNLESIASYPRIVIDPKILAAFNDTQEEFKNKCKTIFDAKEIIGFGTILYWGGNSFTNDAIMIDWFQNTFFRKESHENFFLDLKYRMGLNHQLFVKGMKLSEYLLASTNLLQFKEGTVDLKRRDIIRNEILKILGKA